MAQKYVLCAVLLLSLVTEIKPQFFDYFNTPRSPPRPSTRYATEYTTRRTKIDTIRTIANQEPQITWKNTTISFVYEGEEDDRLIQTVKEKKRKNPLLPIFNADLFTTPKPIRKDRPSRNNTSFEFTDNSREINANRKNNDRVKLSYDVDVSKHSLSDDENYKKPVKNLADYYDTTNNNFYPETTRNYNNFYPETTRNYNNYYQETTRNYNNYPNYNNNNYYTTKNPIYGPGVKPAVIDNRPPITNRPVTKRPATYKPVTKPVATNTGRPVTNKPVTVKPYIINPIPTDAGALVYPHEDEQPETMKGPDEDYMSEAEKRRHIEVAERMCDKYKALSTTQLQAIPLLPSPDPVQVNVSQCTPTTVPLVVGGKVVTINEFPHMALLGWVKIDGGGYSWKCGGSLVSEQYVLTAAHCSYQERDNTVDTGPPRVVQLGSSYLDDPGALVVRVSQVVRHPKYKMPRSYYDIALLKLVQPVIFSEVIRPACLGVPPPVDEPIIATGWGKTELGGDQSLELRSVSLPVWNMGKCNEVLGTSRKMPDGPSAASQLCAGEMRGGKDTCQGDSGGPAQIQDGCTWRIVAVTSVGRSCGAPNTPGLYALVHRAFISAQVFGTSRNNRNPSTDNSNENERTNNQRRTTTESYRYSNNQGNGPNIYNQKTTTESSYYNQPDLNYQRPIYNQRRPTTTDNNDYRRNGDRQPYNNDRDYTNERHDDERTMYDGYHQNDYKKRESETYPVNSHNGERANANSQYSHSENRNPQAYFSNSNPQSGYWAMPKQNDNVRQNDDRRDGRVWRT